MGGSSKSQTIGYRFYMTLHIGVARGPLDELVEIRIGDKTAWPLAEGNASKQTIWEIIFKRGLRPPQASAPITGDGVTTINASSLFGGDKGEGGVDGTLTVHMGHPGQQFSAWAKALMGGNVPDFRGVCTMLFDGMICAMNPYPKAWKQRWRRTTQGWDGPVWQPSLVTIWMNENKIKGMNPAHIIYEASTNRDWGRGLPRQFINEGAWLQVAQTLYNEGFGMCIRWTRQETLQTFVQNILNHIGGTLYTDRETGLLTLKLIRDDYDPNTLPLFDYNNGLLEVIDPESAGFENSITEVIVTYHDPIEDADKQVRAQNLALLQSLGAVNSTKTDYSGIPTFDLAARIAQRDLRASSAAIKRYKLKLNRRAWKIYPGAPFRISAPDKGINNLVLRAGKVLLGRNTEGTIEVEAALDVFGLSAASYIVQQESEWKEVDLFPSVTSNRLVREATYYDMFKWLTPGDLAVLDPNSGTIATVAAKPSDVALSYGIATKVSAEAFVQRGSESWAPLFKLRDQAGFYSTILYFINGIEMRSAAAATLVQIDDEIIKVTAINLNEDGVSGTLTVERGCIDTIPATHVVGARGYFLYENVGTDGREYARGEKVDVKLLTSTTSGTLDADLAPVNSLTIAARQGRPYPPGAVFVDWTPCFDIKTVGDKFRIDWAHRDRKLQADTIITHFQPNSGPEAGTSYTLRFYSGSSLLRTIENITDNFRLFTSADSTLVGNLRCELESVRDGIKSFQKYNFTFRRTIS